jgi:paraquat-inducible protein B
MSMTTFIARSKKANPVAIGMFIVVGSALAVVGLIIFSSRNYFRPYHKDILYFDASLKGLNPGAPVKFRGVTIGTVSEVLIRHNQASNDFSMPVIIAIDTRLAQSKSDQHLPIGQETWLNLLVQQGLRGTLDFDSLVTGVLYISLDIVPNAPSPVYHQLKPEYHEIPTMPTQVQQLLANLARADVGGLSEKLNALLTRVDTSLSQLNVAEINAGVTNLLMAANQFITAPDLTNSLPAVRRTLDTAEALLKRIGGRVDPLSDTLTNTLGDAQKTFADLRGGIQVLLGLLGPDASLRAELRDTLEELSNASRAITDLADFLQRNPNALLTGRKRPKQEP